MIGGEALMGEFCNILQTFPISGSEPADKKKVFG
jgi:hypothetical protein